MSEELQDNTIRRTFAAELTPGDGRTVDVRIVPYGERIQHNDGLGGVPKGQPYTEEWAPGAFKGQERAANRVLANVEHESGIRGIVGHGVTLREEADGLYGSFKIHETAGGDTALILVREGVLDTVSLEAVPLKHGTVKTREGIVRRVRAHLVGIAFTRFAAYANAKVLAVREGMDIEEEELVPAELRPVDMDPETIERLQRLGVALPQRYQAHPEETDTPASTGTSADGTRQTTGKPNTEEPTDADSERAAA